MALSNIGREPRREITEQVFGLVFVMAYAGWVAYSVHLSNVWHPPLYCKVGATSCTVAEAEWSWWKEPFNFQITFGLSIGIWLIYPALLFMHFLGEIVCGWLTTLGIDPRPKQRR
jgi:hypothetical protein